MMKHVRLLLVFCVLCCNPGFQQEDIEILKRTVRAEFEKQGFTVSEVTFIKESSTKLTGIAKLRMGEIDAIASCTATMGENSQYIWKCD